MPLFIPTPASAIADAVWTYLPNRRLTNLADIRAAFIDNLDVLLSTRSTLTGAQVWAIATRDLTKKVGSEFTLDLLGTVSETFADALIHSLATLVAAEAVGFPAGATLNKATLLVSLLMRNVGGLAQVITPTLYFRRVGDPWGAAVLTIPSTVSLPALADTPFIAPLLIDVKSKVLAGGDAIYEARVDIQASAVANMTYSIEGVLGVAFIGA